MDPTPKFGPMHAHGGNFGLKDRSVRLLRGRENTKYGPTTLWKALYRAAPLGNTSSTYIKGSLDNTDQDKYALARKPSPLFPYIV